MKLSVLMLIAIAGIFAILAVQLFVPQKINLTEGTVKVFSKKPENEESEEEPETTV